jgi:hypothetical protein
MIQTQTLYYNNQDNVENECDEEREGIIHDIIDDIYQEINNNNVISIFEESYTAFIEFLKFNVLIEKSYDMDENINKYSKLYINSLYDVIYSKASYEEELLNDFIYDEDGDFFEYYKNYMPSKNISVVSDLNQIHTELENIVFSLHNLNLLRDYVLKIANLYIILITENDD